MYTTKEAMEILGLKSKTGFFKKVKNHGIVPLKQWRYCFFTDEMIDDLKNDRRRGRPKIKTAAAKKKKATRYCWRVSVWNDELCAYVVAKCGLTRKEADEFAALLSQLLSLLLGKSGGNRWKKNAEEDTSRAFRIPTEAERRQD